jgi:hypothetical protein
MARLFRSKSLQRQQARVPAFIFKVGIYCPAKGSASADSQRRSGATSLPTKENVGSAVSLAAVTSR